VKLRGHDGTLEADELGEADTVISRHDVRQPEAMRYSNHRGRILSVP
jgi:hypothetical protein